MQRLMSSWSSLLSTADPVLLASPGRECQMSLRTTRSCSARMPFSRASAAAVAAALLGALIETLGYTVRFARSPENAEESVRRVRPKVCLVDCADSSMYNDEFIGRAAMRRISVVIFGSAEALNRVRALAL